MEKSICQQPGCPNKGHYCRIPWHPKGAAPVADKKSDPEPVKQAQKKKQKPLKKATKKRAKLNRQYSKVSKPMWEGQPCAIRSPKCIGMAQGWNHAAGKENADKLLDMENGQPACNPCNGWCEDNHAEAVRLGFRNQRNTQTKRYDNTYKEQPATTGNQVVQ